MRYQQGSIGRVFVLRFEDNDSILEGLQKVSIDEDIRAGVFFVLGGIKQGRFVVGPEDDAVLPPKPMWREINESYEMVATGTIFWQGDEPKIHMHCAFGKRDDVKMGCLRQDTKTFLVLEAVILELKGISAVREFDPQFGLALLKMN
ncbi:MAG: DNA-binding protein [Thermodesulfovibrionales bacterium]|nr:DNA-binding protein [Thermodesulfovibrionales bacterium]